MTRQSKYDFLDSITLSEDLREKWQNILNLVSEIIRVPCALIMKVSEKEIEVFAKSGNPENVYHKGEKARLGTGLYCETVMSTRNELLVPNALKDPAWDRNPDIALGMISYLGFPLLWPTGQLFGTICVLDNRENGYSDLFRRILEQFRDAIQMQLALVYEESLLRQEIVVRKRVENALRENYKKLHELESLRDDLFYMIVHDMRTPLMVISANLEMAMKKKEAAEPHVRFLTMAQGSCQKLTVMVDALLDVTRMEEGKMPMNKSSCDLFLLALESVELLQSITLEQDVFINVKGEHAIVQADSDLIRRVIINLLINAVKFSPDKSCVEIAVHGAPEIVRVEVTDQGPGIPEEHQNLIFEKFGHVDLSRKLQKYSTGLGLAFCRMAVESHGGSIGLLSNLGKGSTFWFTLPRESPSAA